MPASSAQHFAFDRAGQLLELVSLGAHSIDVGKHSLQQSLGRGRGYASPLKLPDFAALSVDLGAHSFNFGSEVLEVWHGRLAVERPAVNGSRTKSKRLQIGVSLAEHPRRRIVPFHVAYRTAFVFRFRYW
jgi:hypothetical protein